MERILFIVPPHVAYNSFVNPGFNERVVVKKTGNYGSVITDMPLGPLSLSAYLKKNTAVEIKLVDFNIVLNKMESFEYGSFSELFRKFLSTKEWIDYAPSIIGISTLFTPAYHNTMDIAQVARDLFLNALIIAGGGVPTNMYNEIFRDSTCFDALCYGEGEKPLLGLVQANDKKGFLENSPSWITRKKVKNKQLFQYDFIENLDEIPFLDYEICEIDKYGLNPAITAYNAGQNEKEKTFHVMTSRGCVNRCCFCSSYTVHGRRMRFYSIDRIREDFKRLKEEYGAKTLVFQDDHLMADKKRFLKIIDIVKELRLTVVFQNSLALYALDREVLEALKSAGVNQLVLSVESGSARVLKEIMHKPLSLAIIKRVAEDCRDLGIYTNANILIGLPGETKQDIEDARNFLKTIPANWFMIFCATPLVGSEMFAICLKKNYLKGSYVDCGWKKAIVETEDFTAEYIQEMAYFLNLELNFVENNDFRLGDYTAALRGFEHVIAVKSDHAFATYFAAQCCKRLNLDTKYSYYKTMYQHIIGESMFWKNYANRLNLFALE